MSYIIGLTGPTGAGKGVFSKCAERLGFNVIDCDLCAREAVNKGMPALEALSGAFGADILTADGELDRKKLANVAFSSKENTELLNKTVLPYIAETVKSRITGDFVLLDAPTLFESGIDDICDLWVAVLAPVDLRKERIIARDNIDEAAADARIAAGKDDCFYKKKVDKVFINDSDVDSLAKKVTIYLESIIGGKTDE